MTGCCAAPSGPIWGGGDAFRFRRLTPTATHVAPLQGASMPGLRSAPIPVVAVRNQSLIADKPAIRHSQLGKLLPDMKGATGETVSAQMCRRGGPLRPPFSNRCL